MSDTHILLKDKYHMSRQERTGREGAFGLIALTVSLSILLTGQAGCSRQPRGFRAFLPEWHWQLVGNDVPRD